MDIIIRNISNQDLDRISEIESICFPSAEAAPKEAFQARLEAFGQWFFAAEINHVMVGFIDGCVTNSPIIFDEMFHDTKHHIPNGKNLAVFGLNVLPDYRRNGIAGQLMKHFIESARQHKKEAVILTCKDKLVHYYETFGYINNGTSTSTHGGAQWYDMTLTL